jgi:hypothetical protein
MKRVWVVMAGCAVSVLLAACGGGGGGNSTSIEAKTPNRAVVQKCMEHSGTGARIYQKQLPAQIGGLPAHVEITGIGYEEGELEYAVTTVYLFKDAGEGAEGAESLKGEQPAAEVKTLAGGTAVGVVSPAGGGKPTPKDMKLIEGCVA